MRKLLLPLHNWLTEKPKNIEESFANSNSVVNYAMFLGVFAHLFMLASFVALDQPSLVAFNILSVILFLFALLESKKGHQKIALTVATVELISHAWLVCTTIGLGTFFHIYPLALLVLYPIMSWLPLSQRLALSTIPLCSTILLYTYVMTIGVVSPFSVQTTVVVAALNAFVFGAALMGIMTYAVWSTDSREEELFEEVTTRMLSEASTLRQLDRMLVLTNFSQQAAQATSESDILELYSVVVRNISSSKCYELLLVDTNSGPFGTFYEKVVPQTSGGRRNPSHYRREPCS